MANREINTNYLFSYYQPNAFTMTKPMHSVCLGAFCEDYLFGWCYSGTEWTYL